MQKEDDPKYSSGTSLQGKITGYYYRDLVDALGEPSFPEPSGDNKVQKEWLFKFKDGYYTIYDWKTFDEDYTMNDLTVWHVGGKSYKGAMEFIDAVKQKLESL